MSATIRVIKCRKSVLVRFQDWNALHPELRLYLSIYANYANAHTISLPAKNDMHSLWFGLIEREETRDANGYKVTA